MIYNGDCLDLLAHLDPVDLIFADPPDNIGLKYDGFTDKNPHYYDFLYRVILDSLRLTPVFWLSYYWKHDVEIKYLVRRILKERHPSYEAKTFVWRFTFGQHSATDCGSGFRFLLRLSRSTHRWNTSDILVESERQRLGDPRASDRGRVPDDYWEFDFPRVVGNSPERVPWHPTQHPLGLLCRMVRLCTNPKDRVVDLFGGTGSMAKACQQLDRRWCLAELSETYCKKTGLPYTKELKGEGLFT